MSLILKAYGSDLKIKAFDGYSKKIDMKLVILYSLKVFITCCNWFL